MGRTGTGPRRRVLWTVVLASVAAIAAVTAATAVAAVRPWEAGPTATPRSLPPPEPPPAPVLATAGDAAPAPDAGQLAAALDDLLDDAGLGSRIGVAVVDVATGDSLYGRDADLPVVPASTIKLATAAAVLATRGPAYEIPTTVVAGTEPGEVVLVGGGDPTLARDADGFYPDAARLDLLATQVRSTLGDTPVTSVTVDATRFQGDVHGPWETHIQTGGFVGPVTALMTDGARVDPDPAQGQRSSQRWEQPDLAAGETFAELLGAGDATVARGTAPDGAAVLGEVTSPPVLRLVEYMLGHSDNIVAETLARQVPLARGEPATFDGTAAGVTAVLVELGVDPGDSVIADASGLSRDNRLTAGFLADLLAVAASSAGLFAGLPVAGWSGTLADRPGDPSADGGPATGTVRAKTGSLTGVDTLAGTVVTGDGRLLSFAVLADQVPVGHATAREALDLIPAALAGAPPAGSQ